VGKLDRRDDLEDLGVNLIIDIREVVLRSVDWIYQA
jgi:hypothetical protein